MLIQSHAAFGWAVGVLCPGADRRLRGWCVAASALPDLDAATYLFGVTAYKDWHHVLGHNVLLGVLIGLAAGLHARGWKTGLLAGLCFGAHLLCDMKLSDWGVALAWPFSRHIYELHPNYGIGASINLWLVALAHVVVVPLAMIRGVTPFDLLSPRLDRFVMNLFRRRTSDCATCARRCNNACDGCGRPVCLGHGRLGRGFRLRCPVCA